MIVKMALALRYGDYGSLREKCPYIFEKADKIRHLTTPDSVYTVVYWEYPLFNSWDECVTDLKKELEQYMHSLITITDEKIFCHVQDFDQYGCDEEFREILGWKADICVWGEEDDVLKL